MDFSIEPSAETRSCQWRDCWRVLAVLQLWLLAGCSRGIREPIWQRALYDVWLHANGLPGAGNVFSRSRLERDATIRRYRVCALVDSGAQLWGAGPALDSGAR